MPQMAPINWLILFMLFLFIFLLFIILNYYSFTYLLNMTKTIKKKKMINWKW